MKMAYAQVFCSVRDVLKRVPDRKGEGEALMDDIRAASRFILRHIGAFIPMHEGRYIRANGQKKIKIGPMLDLESVVEDGVTVTDFEEDPYGGEWLNGPFTYLERNDDATWDKKLTVTGWWGLYNELKALGITASQTNSAATLTAANGAVLSPGMVVKIDDEAELVEAGNGGPGSPAATAATSKLNGAVEMTDTSIPVDNGAEFYTGEVLQIGTEHILLTQRSGNDWAVVRSYNGTTAADHADDASIAVFREYAVARGVNGTTSAAHSSAGVSRFVVPEDVLYLAVEMAVLMGEKAGTNFGGRAGNTDQGEAFFVNEFPKNQIEAVKSNYSLPYL